MADDGAEVQGPDGAMADQVGDGHVIVNGKRIEQTSTLKVMREACVFLGLGRVVERKPYLPDFRSTAKEVMLDWQLKLLTNSSNKTDENLKLDLLYQSCQMKKLEHAIDSLTYTTKVGVKNVWLQGAETVSDMNVGKHQFLR